jgi:hypothetical protein
MMKHQRAAEATRIPRRACKGLMSRGGGPARVSRASAHIKRYSRHSQHMDLAMERTKIRESTKIKLEGEPASLALAL